MARENQSPYRILSMDGGGVYALSYIPVLEHLEEYLGCNIVNSGQFQMFVGTSTGSIVGSGLKLGMSLAQIKKLYFKYSRQIFSKNNRSERLFYQFKSRNLQKALLENFGDITWGELCKYNEEVELVLTLWNVSQQKLLPLSSNPEHQDFEFDFSQARLADILTACCADPFYFAPQVFDFPEKKQVFCDGGVAAVKNPSALGTYLLKENHPDTDYNIQVVSLGTGETLGEIPYKEITRWTSPDISLNTINSLVNSSSQQIEEFFEKYSEDIGISKYFRTNQERKFAESLEEIDLNQLSKNFQEGNIYGKVYSFTPEEEIISKTPSESASETTTLSPQKIKQEAAKQVEDIEEEEILPSLIQAIHSKDWVRSFRLAEALSKIELIAPEVILSDFLRKLKNESYQIRKDAVWVFKNLPLGSKKSLNATLQELLSSGSELIREEAAWLLGYIGNKKSVPALVVRLQDKERAVRRHAAWALGQIGEKAKEAIPDLIESLGDKFEDVGKKASWALSEIGSQSTEAVAPKLLEVLETGDDFFRKEALTILGRIGLGAEVEKAVPTLMKSLKTSINGDSRYWAGLALKKISGGRKEVVSQLAESWKSEEAQEKKDAIWALSQIQPIEEEGISVFKEALKDEDISIRTLAIDVLGNLKFKEMVPQLIQIFQEEEDPDLRASAVKALGKIGPDAEEIVPILIQTIKEGDMAERKDAAWLLGKIRSKKAVPVLKQMLQDEEYFLISTAVFTVGDLNPDSPRTIPSLLDALLRGDYGSLRLAICSLGEIGADARSAIPELIQLLRNRNEFVREETAKALGNIGSEANQAVPALIDSLHDISERVRINAALALGKIGDKEAIPALTDALQDPNESVQKRVREALEKIGKLSDQILTKIWEQEFCLTPNPEIKLNEFEKPKPKEGHPKYLLRSHEIRTVWYKRFDLLAGLLLIASVFIVALGIPYLISLQNKNQELAEKYLKTQTQILLADDWSFRVEAANKLLEMGKEAIPTLIQALEDKNIEVRSAAALVLGKIGEDAIPALLKTFKNKNQDMQAYATIALAKMGKVVVKPLLKVLEKATGNSRARIIEVLGDTGDSETVDVIQDILENAESQWEKVAAIDALGKLKAQQSFYLLQRFSQDENKEIREHAEAALKKINEAENQEE